MLTDYRARFRDLFAYRWLLGQLVARDLKIRYRRSYLGLLWTLLSPLLMMTVMSIVFSKVFRFNVENFPVYLLCGQILFGFFSESTSSAMGSIIIGAGLIKKVYFPKYIFPLSKIISGLVNLLFALVAVFIMIVFFGVRFSPAMLLFPVPVFYLFMFSLGCGLILSVLATYFRDILHLYAVALQALTYLTPIFYPIEALPENVQFFIKLNPMFRYIRYFRNVVLYDTIPSLRENIICFGVALLVLLLGLLIFKKNQKNFLLYI
jgi:ABC-2 type transport system permease protein